MAGGSLVVVPLLSSFCGAAVAFLLSSPPAGGISSAEEVVTALITGPLWDQDILLVTDDHSHRVLDVNRIVAVAGASLIPVISITQNSLINTTLPPRDTKGSHFTAFLLFRQDPTQFLMSLAHNLYWNPRYLVLFCLNSQLDATGFLSLPVVQRSFYISLMYPMERNGRTSFYTYTSLPMLVSSNGRPLIKAPLGLWSPKAFPSRQSLFPPRFKDFGGVTLEVSVVCYDEPFVYVSPDGIGCAGSNLDALQIIGDKHNFQLTQVSPAGVTWGAKVNGTWNGMLGQLMYEGKHFSVNVLQPSPDRASEFDYTYPYWEDGFAILIIKPPPFPQWRNVLYPFTSLMWGLIFATMVSVSLVLSYLLRYLENIKDSVGMILKISGGLVNQPMGDGEIRAWWARVWLVFWWVVVDILAAAYMSNLVAVLSVPVYPSRINTVYDLAHSDYIPSMGDYGDFAPQALKISDNPTLALIGSRLHLEPITDPSDSYGPLIKKVLQGTHAIMVTVDYLIYAQHNNNLTRTTYVMDELIFQSYMSWFLPRNTPYTRLISDEVIQLLETGIMHKLYRDHVGGYIGKEAQVRGSGVLKLEHLQGAFIVLVLGVLVALIAQLGERLLL